MMTKKKKTDKSPRGTDAPRGSLSAFAIEEKRKKKKKKKISIALAGAAFS